jgi:hypothetical protein
MATPSEQRAEEVEAIERERQAFERRRGAIFKVQRQFFPTGNGSPAKADMDELDASDHEWRAAQAVVDRIVAEIRSGARR